MSLDKITIGRDPVLTYAILSGIAARRRKTSERKIRWAKIRNLLKFWKPCSSKPTKDSPQGADSGPGIS